MIAMASIEQIFASRKNGARSRGPRTNEGKARSSRNALRHGLTANILNDSTMRSEAGSLAAAIAGPNASSARLAQAWTIAETQLDLLRIRNAQIELMNSACAGPSLTSEGPGQGDLSGALLLPIVPQLLRWHDYERKIRSRLTRAIRAFRVNAEP